MLVDGIVILHIFLKMKPSSLRLYSNPTKLNPGLSVEQNKKTTFPPQEALLEAL